jgi:hypothetical protein
MELARSSSGTRTGGRAPGGSRRDILTALSPVSHISNYPVAHLIALCSCSCGRVHEESSLRVFGDVSVSNSVLKDAQTVDDLSW